MSVFMSVNGAQREITEFSGGGGHKIRLVLAGEAGVSRKLFELHSWEKWLFHVEYIESGSTVDFGKFSSKFDLISCSSEPYGSIETVEVADYTPTDGGLHEKYPYLYANGQWFRYKDVYITSGKYRITARPISREYIKDTLIGIVYSGNIDQFPANDVSDGYLYIKIS